MAPGRALMLYPSPMKSRGIRGKIGKEGRGGEGRGVKAGQGKSEVGGEGEEAGYPFVMYHSKLSNMRML